MVSCPVMTEEGQVFALAQKSSGADTATICYAVDADFAMEQNVSAFSFSDMTLKNIGIKKALPDTEEQALVFLFMASSQVQVTAPHVLTKPVFSDHDLFHFVHGGGAPGAVFAVLQSAVIQILGQSFHCGGNCGGRSSNFTNCFSRVSRRTSTHWPFSISRGPTSRRTGTPFISHWANFQPGCLSESSSFTRAYLPISAASSRHLSSTPGLWAATGTMTTCTGAMAGGQGSDRRHRRGS